MSKKGKKRNRLSPKKSSTPGKSKGPNCQRSQDKNLYSKDARLYKKDPENYERICKVINKMN